MLSCLPSGMIFDASIGVMVKADIKENIVAKVTVSANSFRKPPTMEDMDAIGRNTTMFVSVEAITATVISAVPR
ncbi:hypothetical protein DSECCO2_498360 [anaerobic digester metagenome]